MVVLTTHHTSVATSPAGQPPPPTTPPPPPLAPSLSFRLAKCGPVPRRLLHHWIHCHPVASTALRNEASKCQTRHEPSPNAKQASERAVERYSGGELYMGRNLPSPWICPPLIVRLSKQRHTYYSAAVEDCRWIREEHSKKQRNRRIDVSRSC